jgi:catechol 2,3-dioxygenase-like lactoylglutathione lyase family enzyme
LRLNHIDLHVTDVAASRDFLVSAFDLRVEETRGRDGLSILCDDAGLEIVISRPVERLGSSDPVSVGKATYHIGFIVDLPAEVDAVYARISAMGLAETGKPSRMRGGYLFYTLAPGGILVEVGCRSADASLRSVAEFP